MNTNWECIFSHSLIIDSIPDAEFAGRCIREHPTFKRFTRTNGWCYLELLGNVGEKREHDGVGKFGQGGNVSEM